MPLHSIHAKRSGLAAVAAALFGLGAGFYLHADEPHAAIVMLGDSITAGTNRNALLPTFDVANRGVPGDTTEGVLKRLDSIIAMQPQCVAVMLGVNDLQNGRSVQQISEQTLADIISLANHLQ